MSAALDKAVHHVHHPRGPFSARCALATRLMFVKLGTDQNKEVGEVDHVRT
jgi:hypothetical protein